MGSPASGLSPPAGLFHEVPLADRRDALPTAAILPLYKHRHFQAGPSADSRAWVLIQFLHPERRKHGGGDSLEFLLLQTRLWGTRTDPGDQGPVCRGSPSPPKRERVSLGARRAVSLSLLKLVSWGTLSQPCSCLCPLQGNRLWLLERTVQSSGRPGKLDIWLPGQHHQSYPHPAGLHRAGVWRTRGAAPA